MADLGLLMVEKLLKIVEDCKLNEVYNDVEDWLYDFYPDLHWDERAKDDIDTILNHDKFEVIQSFFTEKYGFDFKTELERAKKSLNAIPKS